MPEKPSPENKDELPEKTEGLDEYTQYGHDLEDAMHEASDDVPEDKSRPTDDQIERPTQEEKLQYGHDLDDALHEGGEN
ncbi:hypothetical protein KY386_00210 [Candidatus Parcubacteria bacterium]|nr:hypothetical protein [Candidatus Parcubacteria bacterium]